MNLEKVKPTEGGERQALLFAAGVPRRAPKDSMDIYNR